MTTSSFLQCGVAIRHSYIQSDTDLSKVNEIESYWAGTSSNGTLNISPIDPSGYWAGNTAPTGWYYADLLCDVPNGAAIKNYTVVELGTKQTTSRIFSMLSCKPPAGNVKEWEYRSEIDYASKLTGSFMYSNGGPASGGGANALRFECPVPNNSKVEVSAGPSYEGDGNVNGCNIDSPDLSSVLVWPTVSGTPNLPVQFLPLASQPYIFVPALGTHKVTCGMKNPGNGDGRLVSMRVGPQAPLSRSGWTATASANSGSAGNAFDNNNGSRWTTGTNQVPGQELVVDMKATTTIKRIVLDSAGSSSDYPRGYQVFVSSNGTSWGSPVVTGSATGPLVEIKISAATRYFKIVQTGTAGNYWSVHELLVY